MAFLNNWFKRGEDQESNDSPDANWDQDNAAAAILGLTDDLNDELLGLEEGDVERLEELIEEGADVDASDPETGRTLLHTAAAHGWMEIAEVLVSKGASILLRDNQDKSAADLAIRGHYEDVATLMVNGLSVYFEQQADEKEELELELEEVMTAKVAAEQKMLQAQQQVLQLEEQMKDGEGGSDGKTVGSSEVSKLQTENRRLTKLLERARRREGIGNRGARKDTADKDDASGDGDDAAASHTSQKHNEIVEALRGDLAASEESNDRLRAQLDTLREDCDRLTNELQETAKKSSGDSDLQVQLREAEEKVLKVEKERERAERALSALKEYNANLGSEKDRLANQVSTLNASLSSVRDEQAKSVSKLAQLEQDVLAVSTERDRAQEDLESMTKERNALRDEGTSTEEKRDDAMSELKEELATLKKALRAAEDEVQEAASASASQRTEHDAKMQVKEQEVEEKEAQLKDVQAQLKVSQDNLKAKVEEVTELTSRLDDDKTTLKQLEWDVSDRDSKLKAATSELSVLETTKSRLETQVQQLTEEGATAASDVTRVTGQRDSALSKCKELKAALGKAEKRAEDAEESARMADKLRSTLADNKAALEEQLKDARDGKDDDVSRLEEEASSLGKECASLTQRLQDAEHELTEAQESVSTLQSDLDKEQELRKKAEKEASDLAVSKEKLESELSAHEEDLEDAKDSLSEAEKQLDNVRKNLTTARDEAESATARVTEMQSALDQATSASSAREKELASQLEAARDEIDGVVSEREVSEKKVAALTKDVKTAKSKAKEMKSELKSVKDDLKVAQDDLKVAQDDLKVAQDDLKVAQDDLKVAQDDLKVAHDELKSAQDDLSSTQDELKSAQDKLADEQEVSAKTAEDLASMKSQLSAATTAVEASQSEAKQAEEQVETLQSEVDDLRKELDTARDENEQTLKDAVSTTEVDDLRQQLQRSEEEGKAAVEAQRQAEERLVKTEFQLKDAENALADHQATIKDTKKKLELDNDELNELRREADDAVVALEECQAELAETKQALKEATTLSEDAAARVEDLSKQVEELEGEVAKSRTDAADLSEHANSSRAAMKALSQAEEALGKTEGELAAALDKVTTLQTEAGEVTAMREADLTRIAELEQEVATLVDHIALSNKEKEELTQTVRELESAAASDTAVPKQEERVTTASRPVARVTIVERDEEPEPEPVRSASRRAPPRSVHPAREEPDTPESPPSPEPVPAARVTHEQEIATPTPAADTSMPNLTIPDVDHLPVLSEVTVQDSPVTGIKLHGTSTLPGSTLYAVVTSAVEGPRQCAWFLLSGGDEELIEETMNTLEYTIRADDAGRVIKFVISAIDEEGQPGEDHEIGVHVGQTASPGKPEFANLRVTSADNLHSSRQEVVGLDDGGSYEFSWARSSSDKWDTIPGATGAVYTPSVDDISCVLQVTVTCSGETATLTSGPLSIDPSVREAVASRVSKRAACEFEVSYLDETRTLALELTQLRVKDGSATHMKHQFHKEFAVIIDPSSDTHFTVKFNERVSMDFDASAREARDIIVLTLRTFSLMHQKKQARGKGGRRNR